MEKENLNIYQKAIESIIAEGYVIVQIIPQYSEPLYFSVNTFIPSFKSSVEEIQYCSLVGVNITDFMRNNSNQIDKRMMLERFKQVVQSDNNPVIRCEFFGAKWFKWAAV